MVNSVPLFQPTVLNGVVQKFVTPEYLPLLNRFPRRPSETNVAVWDVLVGSHAVAKPNVPNSAAHVVQRLGRSQESATMLYFREKKVFEPTTIRWTRAPGQIAQTNAEEAILREVNDLKIRFDNAAEVALWSCLRGSLTYDTTGVQVSIDYQIPTSHKPHVANDWTSATPQQIVADVTAWKRLVSRDGRVPATEAFCTSVTMQYIFAAFAGVPTLLSDTMKNAYYQSGILQGFLGLTWTVVESIFDDDSGTPTLFLADKSIILGNFTANDPIFLLEGPSADFQAPDGFTGLFSKTWFEEDPSGQQFLLEWSFLPVLQRPEQLVYVADITATS